MHCEIFSLFKMKYMKTTIEKGNWKERKDELKQKFAVLTDNEQIFEEGETEEIFGKLQIKLGKSKEELRKIINEL